MGSEVTQPSINLIRPRQKPIVTPRSIHNGLAKPFETPGPIQVSLKRVSVTLILAQPRVGDRAFADRLARPTEPLVSDLGIDVPVASPCSWRTSKNCNFCNPL